MASVPPFMRGGLGDGAVVNGGVLSAEDLLRPGRLAGTGFEAAWPLLDQTYRDARVEAALEEEKRGEASIVELPVDDLRAALAELSAQ